MKWGVQKRKRNIEGEVVMATQHQPPKGGSNGATCDTLSVVALSYIYGEATFSDNI